MKASLGALMLAVLVLTGCAQTQVRLAEPEAKITIKPERVVLMPPEINLYELQFGGQLEPRADWTLSARSLVVGALKKRLSASMTELTDAVTDENPDPRASEQQIRKLADAVMNSVWLYEIGWARDSLKNKRGRFDWTLGPGAQVLKTRYKADYALFLGFEDSYTSAGRAAGMAIGALLGVSMSGGVQVGFAALVDTQTGRVAWYNLLIDGSGDLRNARAASISWRKK